MTDVPVARRHLFGSVATYRPLDLAEVRRFMRQALDGILLPHVDEKVSLGLQWFRVGQSYARPPALHAVDLDAIPDDTPLEWISVSGWREEGGPGSLGEAILATCAHFSQDEDRASTLEFSGSMLLFGDGIDAETQQQAVALLKEAFLNVQAVTGYLTIDYVSAAPGSMSPYERSVGLAYPWAALEFRRYLRGYYWGTLLHDSHAERLGGPQILAQAPATKTERLDGRGYYLQLSDDINDIDSQRLKDLKEFLEPLLPEGYEQSPEYYASLPDFRL